MAMYQAPELLDGDMSPRPTKEADIYACGMVRPKFLLCFLLRVTERGA